MVVIFSQVIGIHFVSRHLDQGIIVISFTIGIFRINEATGAIQLGSTLDRETTEK